MSTLHPPVQFEILAALREWRQRRCREEELPPYVVLTNQLMSRIAETCPQNEEELRTLKGMGPARVARYGREILELVGAFPPPSAGGDATPSDEQPQRPTLRAPLTYRVVIEYQLDDDARRQLVQEMAQAEGAVLNGLRDALGPGPARVSIRIESERAA